MWCFAYPLLSSAERRSTKKVNKADGPLPQVWQQYADAAADNIASDSRRKEKDCASPRQCRGAPRCRCDGSLRIQLTVLTVRRFGVVTQGVRRGAHGANEPCSIAKPAGCDGNGP